MNPDPGGDATSQPHDANDRLCRVGPVEIGVGRPLCVIAGPCVLESLDLCLRIGETVGEACAAAGFSYIFKASFDKANRSSASSPRGPGLERGLEALSEIARRLDVPVTTDIHESAQAAHVAEVADLIQIPAFLCRQTDLLAAAARTGRAVNVKKGQFVAPAEMRHAVEKVREHGGREIMLTERGTFFGYHMLVNDFAGLGDLMELGVPVCFDITHSTQLPGASTTSGGRPQRAGLLARAAVAAGVDAIFLECHPDPSSALSDAATMLPLDETSSLLQSLARIRNAIQDLAR